MPYKMIKNRDGTFKVTSPHGTKSEHTSAYMAKRQMNLLRAVEHGWKPTGKKSKRSK